MNRIQLLESGQAARRQQLKPRLPNHQTPHSSKRSPQHSFFVPLHYESNYAYPLLVWLHGPNDDHRQLKTVMPHVSVRNYVGVAPVSPGPIGDTAWPEDAASVSEAIDQVEHCVTRAASRFNIARHRVFLAGFHHGGTMAMRVALAAPERFAGAASIEGPFPVGRHPMANLTHLRSLPLMIAHGRDSDVYDAAKICSDLRLFHVAGMSLNLRQYPCGHELTTQMLSDLNAWMMQIVTGVDTSGASAVDQLSLEN